MKTNEIHSALLELAKELGISIRKENGKFKSGFCFLNDSKIIIFNKSTTIEMMNLVLVSCLVQNNIEDHFIKPALREYIDKEKEKILNNNDFKFEVEY
jgi:hypothetical protein